MNWERPVAQVVVFGSPSPSARADVERRLRQMGGAVWTREPHWVVGTFPLPGSEPDSAQFIRHGLAFVEGRDRVEEAYGADAPERVVILTERTSTIAQMPGDFTFAKVDGDTVQLVRSCAGMGHWFTHRGRDFVMAATRLRLFEDVLDLDLPIDELAMITAATECILPWNRTPLADVTVLPPAHNLQLKINRAHPSVRYWDPADIPAATRPCDTGERSGSLRKIVMASLDRELSTTSPNMVTFSGGVDSSVVAALAKRMGRHVETVSIIPDEGFAGREPTVRSIQTFLDQVDVDGHWPHLVNEHTWVRLLGSAPPVRTPIVNPTVVLGAQHGGELGASTLAGGESADELFGGWNTFYKAWVPSLGLRDLAHTVSNADGIRVAQTIRSWSRDRLRRSNRRLPFSKRLHHYIRADLRAEYDEMIADELTRARSSAHPRRYTLRELDYSTGWLIQNWEVCSEHGLRRSHPFCSREAIELSMAAHPMDLAWPPKKLLRDAFDGLVPSSHLHTTAKDGVDESPLARVPIKLILSVPDAVANLFEVPVVNGSEAQPPDLAAVLVPLTIATHRPPPRFRASAVTGGESHDTTPIATGRV